MLDHSKTELEAYSFYSKMSLSNKYKTITFFLIFAVFLIMSVITGIMLFENGIHWQPFFPLFLVTAILYLTWRYSPKGVGIKSGKLYIIRKISPLEIPLQKLSSAKATPNLRKETGLVLRVFGSGGAWGYFGLFWSKKWGFFKLHITNDKNSIILESTNNRKTVISPDDVEKFLERLRKEGVSVLS